MNSQEGYVSDRAIVSMTNVNPMRETFNASAHLIFNPDAEILNIGVAQNDLMQDVLKDKVSTSLEFQAKDTGYGDPHGSKKLRDLVAGLINRNFQPVLPLITDHILTTTGAGAAVFFLTLGITNPGDSVLVIAPYYGNFDSDVCVGTQVDNVPFYPSVTDDGDVSIDMDRLEECFQNAKEKNNKNIKAVLITNPHNPLGKCFSRESLETVLKFASKHTLHVISDEVYALSTFSHILDEKQENPFTSLLSFGNLDQLIDPALVHVIYGFSKDFCLNGFRVGFIIDQHNTKLRQYLKSSALFSYISSIMDRLLRNMLEDAEWVDSFFATNQRRIADAYKCATSLLDKHGLNYIPSQAGHFLMVDATSHPKISTVDDEKAVFFALLEQGVYIAPGHIFHTRKPGYFRLTFTLDRQKLETGLSKLAKVLQQL
ncbi:pyridoxal phosphate-dependent transferase [Zychaea mexicana]|uniref:pyridoxal phosphate-dependent transferase n=1 Tax=Zychaea mexicana TaxID=64656 RepID=UPI0022FF2DD9|nr:pyridoxal phosphate-dependent transferase [Zychaea mexicana]KAI9493257.1 pyridoxal phosphate-dependent transferase [Zychaea mexicana]